MGGGRSTTKRNIARQQGDEERASNLAPPSERRLTDAERCGALTQKETPCQSQKGARTDHPGYGNCVKHGGNTEAGIKSAMREMGADLMHRYKHEHLRFGGDRNDPSIASMTPESALLEEVRRSAAMVRFLEERIAMWNLDSVSSTTIDKFVNTSGRLRGDDIHLRTDVDEILRALPNEDPDSPAYLPPLTDRHPTTGIVSFTDAREWLYLYREERGHLARTAKLCIDAGVAARLVSIAEDQGRMLSSAIRVILSALELSPEQQARIPVLVPHVLRAVATDSPLPSVPQLLALTQ